MGSLRGLWLAVSSTRPTASTAVLIALTSSCAFVACYDMGLKAPSEDGGTNADSDSGANADIDTDTDSDTDTDKDTDTDTNTDTDADTDSGSETECGDPVPGAPTVTSAASIDLATAATSGSYELTFSEDVVNVDELSVTWTATSGGTGTLDAITAVDASTYALDFSGVSYSETYTISVGMTVTDLCGTPLAAAFTVNVGWAPLSCPLPNAYTIEVPFAAAYSDNQTCSPEFSSYKLWDLSALGAVAVCFTGNYDTESCCDFFFVEDGSGIPVFTGAGTGSYNQVVEDDQVITCINSDYSIVYTGYTVTGVTWL